MNSIGHLLQNCQLAIFSHFWSSHVWDGGEADVWASIRAWPQVATRAACRGGAPPRNPPFALRAERQGEGAKAQKPKEPTRSEVIKIRVTPDEKADLRRLAGSGTIAELFRAMLEGRELRPQRIIKTADYRLLYQLNRIGNNLNQVAKGINRSNKLGSPVDVAAVAARLKQIHSAIRSIYAAQDTDGDDS